MLNFLLGYGVGTGVSPGPTVPMRPASDIHAESELRSKSGEMEMRLNALELACAGLWKVLKAKGLSDDELVKAIEEVDLLDGVKDGRITPQAAPQCPSCGKRALSRQVDKCLWCGAPMEKKPFAGQ